MWPSLTCILCLQILQTSSEILPSTVLAVLSHSLQKDAQLLAPADAVPEPDLAAVFSQMTANLLQRWKSLTLSKSSWAQDLDVGSVSLLAQLHSAAQQWEEVSLIFEQRKSSLQVTAWA